MALDNCPRCGRLYVKNPQRLCPACLQQEEEEYQKVRAYLKEHPDCTLFEVAEATGVEESTILRFLRQGRISASGNPNLGLQCERCGEPIDEGRLCKQCAEELAQGFAAAIADRKEKQPKPNRKDKSRMHVHRHLRRNDPRN